MARVARLKYLHRKDRTIHLNYWRDAIFLAAVVAAVVDASVDVGVVVVGGVVVGGGGVGVGVRAPLRDSPELLR